MPSCVERRRGHENAIKIGENYYIVGVTKREEASMDEFAKQRSTLMEQKLNSKRQEVFSDYLASTKQRMETAGQITIYNDVVAKIDANDVATPSALPQFPGLPPQQYCTGRNASVNERGYICNLLNSRVLPYHHQPSSFHQTNMSTS